MAILGLIQTYCECPVDSTKFHNSTTSCSKGTITFSSTLAHASDDGTVTATVLIELFEAVLAKDGNPTISVDGKELVVSAYMHTQIQVPKDDDNNLVCIVLVSSTTILMSVVILFIIIWSVIVEIRSMTYTNYSKYPCLVI